MNLHEQHFVCWRSVGPKDIKHTFIHARHLQQLLHKFDIASFVIREKRWILFKDLQDDSHSSLVLYSYIRPCNLSTSTRSISQRSSVVKQETVQQV